MSLLLNCFGALITPLSLQWAGEVISSSRSDKVSDNDEFKELEKDIELRKDGLSR